MKIESPRSHAWWSLAVSFPGLAGQEREASDDARERLKTIAVNVLRWGGLSLVAPAVLMLAANLMPGSWGSWPTAVGILALLAALFGVGATTLVVIDGLGQVLRILRRVRSDEAWRLEDEVSGGANQTVGGGADATRSTGAEPDPRPR